MMFNLTKLLNRTSRPLPLLINAGALAAVGAGIAVNMRKLSEISGAGILDFEFGYPAEKVRQILGTYGAEGMSVYGAIQSLDMFNPLLYSLFAASLFHIAVRNTKFAWFALTPFVVGILDYIENGFLYSFVKSYPEIDEGGVGVASVISMAKHTGLYTLFPIAAFSLVFWFRRRANPPSV